MSDEGMHLSRRTILAGVGAVGAAGAAAGLGTSAFFSDEETFENNTLTAGSLDLRVDWEEHYWNDFDLSGIDLVHVNTPDETPDGYVALPDPENPMVAVDDIDAFMDATSIEAYPDSNDDGIQDDLEHYDACEHFAQLDEDLDPINGGYDVSNDGVRRAKRTENEDTLPDQETPAPLVNLHDVKPGDFGELTLSFHLCDNPGYVWLIGDGTGGENGVTEAEEGSDVEGEVELLDEMQTMLWYDEDGDNVFDPGGESEDADVVLVLDRSGSMGGSPMADAKDAAKTLVDELGANTQVGVVSFASGVSLDQGLTSNKQDAKDAIDALSASGSTNLEGGVRQAHEELLQGDQFSAYGESGNAQSGADKVMVVLSDGTPNVDDDGDSSSNPTDEATAAKDDGIEIFTVGFGGANMSQLEAMASDPTDTHAFEGEQEELTTIFSQIGQILIGEQAFFRGTLRELLDAVSDGAGIPLDGDRSTDFDELNDDDAHENREEFVNSTNNFIGLAWWVPRSVGNQIQSDGVAFDLGFRAEQSRHNDGSGTA